MAKPGTFENYPCSTILKSSLVSITIYLIGAYIIYQLGIVWLLLYLLCIIAFEIRLMKKSCANCYYYGKYCAFGKGKLSSLIVKKGNPEAFRNRKITWKSVLPDFLISLVPAIAGIALLISRFSWLTLLLVVLLLILAFAGNGFVRSSLACKYCKQRELGCPAERLFNKK